MRLAILFFLGGGSPDAILQICALQLFYYITVIQTKLCARLYSCQAARLYGCMGHSMAVWLCICAAVWLYSCLAVCLFGCTAIWAGRPPGPPRGHSPPGSASLWTCPLEPREPPSEVHKAFYKMAVSPRQVGTPIFYYIINCKI